VYATVLTERLINTNDKAKRFEIANRQLEQMTNQKVNEMALIKDRILGRLGDVSENHLVPLYNRLSTLSGAAKDTQREELTSALGELREVLQMMQPLIDLHRNEQALASKKVLLVDKNKRQHLITKVALEGTGITLRIAADLEAAQTELAHGKFDLVFCDPAFIELASVLQANAPDTFFVLMTQQELRDQLETLKSWSSVNNMISRDLDGKSTSVKTISTTAMKLLGSDFFGLEKYLSWGGEAEEARISASDGRAAIIEKMKQYFRDLGIRNSILDRCAIVTEELLMNALYDAAVDSKGAPLFNHLPRTQAVQLSVGQHILVRYACDGMSIAISVSDPFGSLEKSTILSYLESCYGGKDVPDGGGPKGGAGKGLHQIVENADMTVFNIREGERTEVIAFFSIEVQSTRKENGSRIQYFFVK
jgi:CheY-like chemotaxis protein